MNSTLILLTLYVITIFFISYIARDYKTEPTKSLSRSTAIDGFRGILATSVVCHHFAITYYWKNTGIWQPLESTLLNNMGAIPVSFFFMITGFLFFGKIFSNEYNWKSIIKSRILRIAPLYFAVVFIVLIISIKKTNLEFATLKSIAKDLALWALFLGNSFNNFNESAIVTAGVQWTLRYEWFFYISLPILAYIFSSNRFRYDLIISTLIIAGILAINTKYNFIKYDLLLPFLCGIIPVIIKRKYTYFLNLIKLKIFSLFNLLVLIYCLSYTNPYSTIQTYLLGFCFITISLGNDMFGLLTSHGLRFIGEISYSIYLTHGIILYSLFSLANIIHINNITFNEYIYFFPAILVLTTIFSTFTFRWIEKPFINK